MRSQLFGLVITVSLGALFFRDFLKEYYILEKNLTEEEMQEELNKRNAVFRDLGDRYYEPIYDSDEEDELPDSNEGGDE